MKKTFDDYLSTATKLRAAAFRAETTLMKFLIDFESSGTWKEAGYPSFERVLREFRLTSAERLAEYKRGIAIIDGDADVIGVPATIEAGKIEGTDARSKFLASARQHVEEGGFPLANERARELRQGVEPFVVEPENLTRKRREAERIAELESANRTLRAENAELRKRVGALTKQLEKLSKGKGGTAHPN
jgi:hypothetical protein